MHSKFAPEFNTHGIKFNQSSYVVVRSLKPPAFYTVMFVLQIGLGVDCYTVIFFETFEIYLVQEQYSISAVNVG